MNANEKRRYWTQHIKACENSSLNRTNYCKQHNISYDQFGYWRKQLSGAVMQNRQLIPVKVTTSPSTASLLLPGGVRLEVPAHALADILPVVYRLTLEASQ